VIRQNGFTIGQAELQYGGVPAPNSSPLQTTQPGQTKISLGGIVEFDDLRVGVKNFSVNFDAEKPVVFNGSIFFASGGAKFFPGKPFSATLSDRSTADDRNPDGSPNTEAIHIELTFHDGKVDAFQLQVDTLEIKLGDFVTLTARDFQVDTGASDSQFMVQFQAVGAKVKVGSLELSGEARNFGFLGDGTFKTKDGFGVFLAVGGATGDSFKWPSFLPIKIDALGVQWADIEHHPEDFVITLSASVTGIKGLSGLEFSGSIQGVKIQPSLLAQGKFPIIALDSLAVTVKGKMFGGEIDAGLVGGILKLDSNFNIIGPFDTTTPVNQRVFYLGLQGGFSMAGMAGFTIRVGLSELGPLSVFINVEVPGGILLEPNTGLTINDFSAGVEFFKTLPSLDDPFALRGPIAGLPTSQTADQWLTGLQAQVAAQARAIAANPSQSGFAAAFTAPMTITGGAKIYSIYTSQQVFNGEVIVKISTDGKFLIIGKLNFADGNISISGKLYADLSKVSNGNVTVLFLADVPDQLRILTIYGKLKMGFRNSSGQEVSFDVVPVAVSTGGGTARPTVLLAGPAATGGAVDLAAANSQKYGASNQHYIDVTYSAPAGANIDWAQVLGNSAPFTFSACPASNCPTTIGSAVPVVAVTTDGGVEFHPLLLAADSQSVTLDGATVISTADFDGGAATPTQLMAAAIDKTGTRRFRYTLGSYNWVVGNYTVHFDADKFKNVNTTDSNGNTVTGLGNTAVDVGFRVDGPGAIVVDPGDGGSIDINVLNDRNWIDIVFTAPTTPTGLVIDDNSITDLAPEFTLGGDALGTIQLDPTKAPVRVDTGGAAATSKKYRYWLTGKFGSGSTITVTPIGDSWSYDIPTSAFASTGLGEIQIGLTGASQVTPRFTPNSGPSYVYLLVQFPDAGTNNDVDDATVTDAVDASHEIEIGLVGADAPLTTSPGSWGQSVTLNGWTVSVDSGAPEKIANTDGLYRYKLNVSLSSPTVSAITVQYRMVASTWSIKPSGGGASTVVTSIPTDFNDPTKNPNLRSRLSGPALPTAIGVTIPNAPGSPFAAFTLDRSSVNTHSFADANPDKPGTQLAVTDGSDWVVTVDEGRDVTFDPATDQWFIPITVEIPDTSMFVSATIAPALDTGSSFVTGVGYKGAATGTTVSVDPLASGNWADTNARSYIDIRFSGGTDAALVLTSINGNEFALSGTGATGFSGGTFSPTAIYLGNNVWRYLLSGDFRAGQVDVTFAAGSFDAKTPARGPPASQTTISNAEFKNSFAVVGATADLVRTIPATADAPETVVAMGGTTVGRDVINGLGYLSVRFTPTSGNALDAATINGDELELRDANGILLSFSGAPIREGTSNVWRYTLAGALVAGKYTVTFKPGSFADQSGVVNQAETETFTVAARTPAPSCPRPRSPAAATSTSSSARARTASASTPRRSSTAAPSSR
jgi:hypothetical protein